MYFLLQHHKQNGANSNGVMWLNQQRVSICPRAPSHPAMRLRGTCLHTPNNLLPSYNMHRMCSFKLKKDQTRFQPGLSPRPPGQFMLLPRPPNQLETVERGPVRLAGPGIPTVLRRLCWQRVFPVCYSSEWGIQKHHDEMTHFINQNNEQSRHKNAYLQLCQPLPSELLPS